MTREQHYAKAEQILAVIDAAVQKTGDDKQLTIAVFSDPSIANAVRAAQIHATLALAPYALQS